MSFLSVFSDFVVQACAASALAHFAIWHLTRPPNTLQTSIGKVQHVLAVVCTAVIVGTIRFSSVIFSSGHQIMNPSPLESIVFFLALPAMASFIAIHLLRRAGKIGPWVPWLLLGALVANLIVSESLNQRRQQSSTIQKSNPAPFALREEDRRKLESSNNRLTEEEHRLIQSGGSLTEEEHRLIQNGSSTLEHDPKLMSGIPSQSLQSSSITDSQFEVQLPGHAVAQLSATANLQSGDRLVGNIYNGTAEWTVTQLTVVIGEPDWNIARLDAHREKTKALKLERYRVPVLVPPHTSSEFSVSVNWRPGEKHEIAIEGAMGKKQ